MAHTIQDKSKLLNRVRRIKGQVEAIEKALEQEEDCSKTLFNIVACRGAINSLMAEVMEGHIWYHIADRNKLTVSERTKATQELVDVIKTYLK